MTARFCFRTALHFFRFWLVASLLLVFCGPALRAERKALLVGISDYPPVIDSKTGKSRERDLQGPKYDVQLMHELLAKLGFTNILTLQDKEATTQGIAQAFHQQLVSGLGPNDTVVFYFSGHGSQVKDLDGDEPDGLDEVVITYDTIISNPSSWITDDRIRVLIASLPTEKAWIIFDCCHSGDALLGPADRPKVFPKGVLPRADPLAYDGTLTGVDPKKRAGILGVTPRGQPRRPQKMPYVFFGACQPNEVAWEARFGNSSNGLFTKALSDIVNKSPDLTIESLSQQLAKRVRAESGKLAPNFQNPFLERNGHGGELRKFLE